MLRERLWMIEYGNHGILAKITWNWDKRTTKTPQNMRREELPRIFTQFGIVLNTPTNVWIGASMKSMFEESCAEKIDSDFRLGTKNQESAFNFKCWLQRPNAQFPQVSPNEITVFSGNKLLHCESHSRSNHVKTRTSSYIFAFASVISII
jgi:hypothetical protein